MAKYQPQYKKEDGTIEDLDICAKYDGNGNEITDTYALQSSWQDLASRVSTLEIKLAELTNRVAALETGGGGGGSDEPPTNLLDAYTNGYDFSGKTLTIDNSYTGSMGSWLVEFTNGFYFYFASGDSTVQYFTSDGTVSGSIYPYMSPSMTFPSANSYMASKVYINPQVMGSSIIDNGTEDTFDNFASNVGGFTFTIS